VARPSSAPAAPRGEQACSASAYCLYRRRLLGHNLPEGAAAGGLAGLRQVAAAYAGKEAGIAMCGGNIEVEALKVVLNGD